MRGRAWKGIFINYRFLTLKKSKINYLKFTKISIWPFMLNYSFRVYSGCRFLSLKLKKYQIYYKLNNFIPFKILGRIHKKKKKR